MKMLSYFFFYTYVGLVVLAGGWGAFVAPTFDFNFLFGFELKTWDDPEKVNLLSQYRFLRALELGVGIFALLFVKEIFSLTKFNTLFLTIMGLGICGRLISWFADGPPSLLTRFFLFYELLGWIIIFVFTRAKLKNNAY